MSHRSSTESLTEGWLSHWALSPKGHQAGGPAFSACLPPPWDWNFLLFLLNPQRVCFCGDPTENSNALLSPLWAAAPPNRCPQVTFNGFHKSARLGLLLASLITCALSFGPRGSPFLSPTRKRLDPQSLLSSSHIPNSLGEWKSLCRWLSNLTLGSTCRAPAASRLVPLRASLSLLV